MTKRSLNNLLGVVLVGFCILLAIIGFFMRNALRHDNLCVAYIDSYKAGGRGNADIWIDYAITLNNKAYRGSSLYRMIDINPIIVKNYLLNRTFPAIYNPNKSVNIGAPTASG